MHGNVLVGYVVSGRFSRAAGANTGQQLSLYLLEEWASLRIPVLLSYISWEWPMDHIV